MVFVRRALLIAACLILAGCVEKPLAYVPPPGLTAETGATITGSFVKTGSFANNEKVFVAEIDNRVTTQNMTNLDVPLLVQPGLHVVKIVACECGFWLRSVAGSVSIAMNFQPGQRYVANAGVPSSAWIMFAPTKSTMAWLEDGSGKPMGPPQPMTLADNSGPVFIPLIIPRH